MRPFLLTILIALLALSGCASAKDEGALAYNSIDENTTYDMSSAERALRDHDLVGARQIYRNGQNGAARAGYAVTQVLLLPYAPSVTRVLTQHLGARDALDTQGDVIWGDQGLVYFLSRGVPWEDGPATAGIQTLLADRLPWSRQQLSTVDGFVDGLDNPVALLADDLVGVADDLGSISDDLLAAIHDDGFEAYFLPGAVFHDDALDLTLGRSELSLIRGVVELLRAGIYCGAAYGHAWTLERAFGESIWQAVIDDPMDPSHVPGYELVDYQVAHVNASLGRSVDAAGRLDLASTAAAAALRALADGIVYGVDSKIQTSLDWRGASSDVAHQLSEFIVALADSISEPTALPYTEPAQTANLAVLFSGRTIASDENLLYVDRFDDGYGIQTTVDIDPDVSDRFIEGAFDPPFDSDPAPELVIGDDVGRLVDQVSGNVADDFERAVGGAF